MALSTSRTAASDKILGGAVGGLEPTESRRTAHLLFGGLFCASAFLLGDLPSPLLHFILYSFAISVNSSSLIRLFTRQSSTLTKFRKDCACGTCGSSARKKYLRCGEGEREGGGGEGGGREE